MNFEMISIMQGHFLMNKSLFLRFFCCFSAFYDFNHREIVVFSYFFTLFRSKKEDTMKTF